MTAGERSVRDVPIKKRRYGYIYAERLDRNKDYGFRCEVEIRCKDKRFQFFFIVHKPDRDSRQYAVSIYILEDCRRSILTAKIFYIDERASTIDASIGYSHAALKDDQLYLLQITHMFSILVYFAYELHEKDPKVPWIIYTTKKFMRDMEHELGRPLEAIISKANLLLG